MSKKFQTRITLPTGIASYPQVFEAAPQFEGNQPEFAITILYPRDADLSKLSAAVSDAIEKKFTSKTGVLELPNSVFDPADVAAWTNDATGEVCKPLDINELEVATKQCMANLVKSGNLRKDKEGKQRPEYAGKVYIKAKCSAENRPKVVDSDVQPILDATEVYGGCELNVSVSAFAWTYGGKSGVSLYLGNVQKVGDGQSFGVSHSVEDDFAAPF